ncbi:MAG: GNAT family N-acetyltransferase [Acidobacteria bacterium]|nr:GNAT family N-acetyltransferase [Acidobacteriota bacterium]
MSSVPKIVIRDLDGLEDFAQAEAVEREVWTLADIDVMPTLLAIAMKAAGSLWVGAFDGKRMVGFAFGFPALEHGKLTIHSHSLGVLAAYRQFDVGFQLKLAQRERALALRIADMSWTFDPLQSRNAHLNFAKLGVICQSYRPDFYGSSSSSALHQNGTDRLWVRWPMATRRVRERIERKLGKGSRAEMLETLQRLLPLVQFRADGKPQRNDLAEALGRQRIAIEIPGDIGAIESEDAALALEWRLATRWAFQEALQAGFFVAEYCRTVRGQQGPGAYLLEKAPPEEYIPDIG